MEFEVRGNRYRTLKLPAMSAFHLARKLGPVLPSIGNVVPVAGMLAEIRVGTDPVEISANDLEAIAAAAEPTLAALAAMSDADSEFVLNSCLAASERQSEQGNWTRVMDQTGKHLMFKDLELPDMLAIAFNVLKDNFTRFFQGAGPTSASGAPAPGSQP